MAARCETCDRYSFDGCGKKPPCPDVVDLINCLGVVFKSKRSKNLFDANLEATFFENSTSEEEEFFNACYSVATKVDLKFVTITEFKLLQRVVKQGSGRYKKLNYSEKEFVLIPAHWANEIRTLKKYLLRLHSLDLSLNYEFIREEADAVDLTRLLWTDGGFNLAHFITFVSFPQNPKNRTFLKIFFSQV